MLLASMLSDPPADPPAGEPVTEIVSTPPVRVLTGIDADSDRRQAIFRAGCAQAGGPRRAGRGRLLGWGAEAERGLAAERRVVMIAGAG